MSRTHTQQVMDNTIFKVTNRKPRKPEPNPSEISTFNYTAHLQDVRWLRMRARKQKS